MPQEKEELFQNKYRIRSYRHQVWDYGDYGWYYVTICTKNRKIFFGNVETHCNASLHQKPKMILSPIGEIIKQCWLETPIIRKNILLDEFIIMPNHVHGIIIIEYKINVNVETHCNASLRQGCQNKFGPQSNNLSAIIRGFKGMAAKIINNKFSRINFLWQPGFHDRIIRNEIELNRIRNYIINNPLKWEIDRNNSKLI